MMAVAERTLTLLGRARRENSSLTALNDHV